MKSFCISLEKNKSEWENITNSIRRMGFEDVEIFPGVNGNEIGNIQRGGYVSEETQKLVDDFGGISKLLSPWARYCLEKELGRKNHAQLSSWGAVGCYLSHILIWNKMIMDELPYCVIFEDDVNFSENFQEDFQKSLKFVPEDADVILLGAVHNFSPEPYNDYYVKVKGVFFGLHAYIITNVGARKFLKNVLPIEIQLDSNMSFSAALDNINIYDIPGLSVQKVHISSIQKSCFVCDINERKFLTIMCIYVLMIFAIIFLLFKLNK